VLSGTICDALMARMPGKLTFAINRSLVGAGVVASDDEVAAAVAFAFYELKLVVEPGGAVALAALMTGKVDVTGKVAVAVLSGGNVDPELFSRLVAWQTVQQIAATTGPSPRKRRKSISTNAAPTDRLSRVHGNVPNKL
jgi:threonine dehydratase